MTPDQLKAIDDALKAADSCRQRAARCAQLGLTVLAREYDYFARSFTERVQWQRRAIDGETLSNQADHTQVIDAP